MSKSGLLTSSLAHSTKFRKWGVSIFPCRTFAAKLRTWPLFIFNNDFPHLYASSRRGPSSSYIATTSTRRTSLLKSILFGLGDWLKTERLQTLQEDDPSSHFAAGYRDGQGACHHRLVSLQDDALQVVDEVQSFVRQAVLRWRLMPGDWLFESSPDGPRLTLNGGHQFSLNVSADVPITRCELVVGWESRHYLEKTPLPVLEVEIQQAGALTTQLQWTE